jgi:sulfonate transport system permease protein
LALWQLSSTLRLVDAQTFSPPSDVLSAGRELLASGELQTHLWASLKRVSVGLGLGITIGTLVAVLAGLSKFGEDIIDSAVQVLRSVPVLALTPLLIIWFGIGEEPKIAMVVIGTTFPIYLNTYAAIRGVDEKLVETATTFGLGRVALVRHVILPGALPGFLVGLRYSISVGWLLLVISEQINATSGIGFLMNDARDNFRTDIIVLGIVIYALLGLLSDSLVRLLERRLLAWRRGFNGV